MDLHFPYDFAWGAATAAFQIEGGPQADGKGLSNWDEFCHTPGRTANGDTGDITCDHYRRWREDVNLMRRLNLNAYRLSISWPRIMPTGRGPINQPGLDFYDRLIDALCAADIQPFVTLFHWDLPAILQHEFAGWLHADLPHHFADYAEVVFRKLGDRVRFWMTLNEPWVVVDAGYFHGVHPPGLTDRTLGYRAGHNLLRAHAYGVERFRALGRADSRISFALNSSYSLPATDEPADVVAAERAVMNFAGWFGHPAYYGDYPTVMRERLGAQLPEFTAEDSRLLKGSLDYLALNYYTSEVVRNAPGKGPFEYEVVAQPHAPHTMMNWPIRPDGFYRLLLWLNKNYPGLPTYITENGAALADEPDERGYVNDQGRIAYLQDHIAAVAAAHSAGVDMRGYFVWSLLDNLEWSSGFAKRFGIVRCDHATQQRTVKASGEWYARLIAEQRGTAARSASERKVVEANGDPKSRRLAGAK